MQVDVVGTGRAIGTLDALRQVLTDADEAIICSRSSVVLA